MAAIFVLHAVRLCNLLVVAADFAHGLASLFYYLLVHKPYFGVYMYQTMSYF